MPPLSRLRLRKPAASASASSASDGVHRYTFGHGPSHFQSDDGQYTESVVQFTPPPSPVAAAVASALAGGDAKQPGPQPVHAGKRADSGNAVYHMAFTWNKWDAFVGRPPVLSDVEFSSRHVELRAALVQLGAKYIFQLEKGKEGRLHYQGYVHWGKGDKKRVPQVASALHAAGFFGLHMAPASDAGKAALKQYVMKADTRVAGPWKDTDPKPMTPEEAKRLQLIDPKALFPWQQYVRDCILSPSDDRSIHWVVDQRGATGKSSFGKLLAAHGEALLLPYSDAKDCLNLVSNAGERRAYIFDLTRTKPASISATDTYSCMEQIKNGYIVNTKYLTKVTVAPPAHVWVFANQPPQFGALSRDRWRVHTIDERNHLTRYDSKQYQKYQHDQLVDAIVAESRAKKRRKLAEEAAAAILAEDSDPDTTQPIPVAQAQPPSPVNPAPTWDEIDAEIARM